jgi:hypothetical protein
MDIKCLIAIGFAAVTSSGAFAQSTPAKDSKPEPKPSKTSAPATEPTPDKEQPKPPKEQAKPANEEAGAPKDSPAGEPAKAKPKPAPPANPIGDAMCGRDSKSLALAAALDGLEPGATPADWPWNKQKVTVLRSWLDAPECTNATPEEKTRYGSRAAALKALEQSIERGHRVMQVREHLVTVSPLVYQDPEWPASCAPCQALRAIADALQTARPPAALPVTPATPAPAPSTIGERLHHEREFAEFKRTLCPLKSRASSLETTVETRFAYFTWTKTGAGVLEAVAVLQRPSFTELCR